MEKRPGTLQRSRRYAFLGFFLGATAPVGWTVVRLCLFPNGSQSLWSQITADITVSSQNIALYAYMGIGTALVLASLGYFIGKASDELHDRAVELDGLHREVASQKEIFENRYKVLDNNIKNFHQISSRIQKSIAVQEVLTLCAEGLHDILGYERVNLLMADEERKGLHFVAGDVLSLARAMKDLIRSEARRNMGQRGREWRPAPIRRGSR